jgi:hypothetical protein
MFDQVTQQYIPKFRSCAMKRKFEILTEGFEPYNPEGQKLFLAENCSHPIGS